jgi:predicted hotdog family 3-hydroxylacyl-ACP dehydratase
MEGPALGTREVLIEDFDTILRLIPQKPPIVMIEKLISSDEFSTTTSLRISESNIFCSGGVLGEAGIIENMAQTAAVRSGYVASQSNAPIPTGFIGAIKNLEIYFLPAVNTEIVTTITIEYQVLNASLISARVTAQGRVVAESDMTIAFKESDAH